MASPSGRAAPVNGGGEAEAIPAVAVNPGLVAPDRPSAAEAKKVAELARSFMASDPSDDFTEPVFQGHEPAAMRKISEAFKAWADDPANKAAEVRYDGIDCSKPPCVMALEFNADRGGDFIGRARTWLKDKGTVTEPYTYPHLLDADHTRLWTFFNPHPKGGREHAVYEAQAIVRIHKEVEGLPSYNPSRDLTSP